MSQNAQFPAYGTPHFPDVSPDVFFHRLRDADIILLLSSIAHSLATVVEKRHGGGGGTLGGVSAPQSTAAFASLLKLAKEAIALLRATAWRHLTEGHFLSLIPCPPYTIYTPPPHAPPTPPHTIPPPHTTYTTPHHPIPPYTPLHPPTPSYTPLLPPYSPLLPEAARRRRVRRVGGRGEGSLAGL